MKNDYTVLWNSLQIPVYSDALKRLEITKEESEMRIWVQVNDELPSAIKEEALRVGQHAYTGEEAEYLKTVQEENRNSGVDEGLFEIRKRKLENELREEKSNRIELWFKFARHATGNLTYMLKTLRNIETSNQFANWFVEHKEYIHYIDENPDINEALIVIDKEIADELNFINSLLSDEEETTETES